MTRPREQLVRYPLRDHKRNCCSDCGAPKSEHTYIVVDDDMPGALQGGVLSGYYICPGQWEDIDQYVEWER